MKKYCFAVVLLFSLMVFGTSTVLAISLHRLSTRNGVLISENNGANPKAPEKKSAEAEEKASSVKVQDYCTQNKVVATKAKTRLNTAKKKEELASTKDVHHEEDKAYIFPLLKQGLNILLQQFRD